MKKEKGITLIALIITIILMLILASVVLNITLGENGLFKVAKKAGEDYTIASIRERVEQEILVLQAGKVTNGEKLTVEETLEELEKNGTFSEIDLEQEEGVTDGCIIKIGYDENGNVYIEEISKDNKTRLIITKDPKGYTNESVKIGIAVNASDKKIKDIELPEGMTKREDGLYEIAKNGQYHIKATLEDGEVIEKTIKINTMDKLPPKAFEIKAKLKDGKIEIEGRTEDTEANGENACSGIERYEYYVNDTKYDTQPIEGLEGDNYNVYVVAYDNAGNHISSPVKQLGPVSLYNSNQPDISQWNFKLEDTAKAVIDEDKSFYLGNNGIMNAQNPYSGKATATTKQLYDLSQYNNLTVTITDHYGLGLIIGILDENNEWIVQKTSNEIGNGDLVIDLKDINNLGRVCIVANDTKGVSMTRIKMTRIVLE